MKLQKIFAGLAAGLALVLVLATGCAGGYDCRTSAYVRTDDGNMLFFGIDYNSRYDSTQEMKCGFLFGHEKTEESGGQYAVYYTVDNRLFTSVYSVSAEFIKDESYNMVNPNEASRKPTYRFRREPEDFMFAAEWFPKDGTKCTFVLARETDVLPNDNLCKITLYYSYEEDTLIFGL